MLWMSCMPFMRCLRPCRQLRALWAARIPLQDHMPE